MFRNFSFSNYTHISATLSTVSPLIQLAFGFFWNYNIDSLVLPPWSSPRHRQWLREQWKSFRIYFRDAFSSGRWWWVVKRRTHETCHPIVISDSLSTFVRAKRLWHLVWCVLLFLSVLFSFKFKNWRRLETNLKRYRLSLFKRRQAKNKYLRDSTRKSADRCNGSPLYHRPFELHLDDDRASLSHLELETVVSSPTCVLCFINRMLANFNSLCLSFMRSSFDY